MELLLLPPPQRGGGRTRHFPPFPALYHRGELPPSGGWGRSRAWWRDRSPCDSVSAYGALPTRGSVERGLGSPSDSLPVPSPAGVRGQREGSGQVGLCGAGHRRAEPRPSASRGSDAGAALDTPGYRSELSRSCGCCSTLNGYVGNLYRYGQLSLVQYCSFLSFPPRRNREETGTMEVNSYKCSPSALQYTTALTRDKNLHLALSAPLWKWLQNPHWLQKGMCYRAS